jgi:hypothetical protein
MVQGYMPAGRAQTDLHLQIKNVSRSMLFRFSHPLDRILAGNRFSARWQSVVKATNPCAMHDFDARNCFQSASTVRAGVLSPLSFGLFLTRAVE